MSGESIQRSAESEAFIRDAIVTYRVCIVEHGLHVVERLANTVFFMEFGRIIAEGVLFDLLKD